MTHLLLLNTGAAVSSIAFGARKARGIPLNIILRNVGEGRSSFLVGYVLICSEEDLTEVLVCWMYRKQSPVVSTGPAPQVRLVRF